MGNSHKGAFFCIMNKAMKKKKGLKRILTRAYALFLANIRKQEFPTDLIFFVTNKCNSQCRGCFYWEDINKNVDELTLEEIRKISLSIGKLNLLSISGGEPFLREDLPEILDIFIENNRLGQIAIPTNGLSTEVILDKMREIISRHRGVIFSISLALDGFRETNDFLRGKVGSFDAVIKTTRALCALRNDCPKLLIDIITTVSNKNYEETEPLFSFVKENLDVNMHIFHPLRGNPKDKSIEPPHGPDWLNLSNKLEAYKNYYLKKSLLRSVTFLSLLGGRSLAKVVARALDKEKWPFDCKGGKNIGVLEPEGSVRLCELTGKIGNVRDVGYDFKNVWSSVEAEKERKSIAMRECTKGCTHGCFLVPSFMSQPFNAVKVYLWKAKRIT